MESRTRPIPTTTSVARSSTRRREIEAAGLTWIDLPQPVKGDITFLRERLRLDPLALDDLLSTTERPKLDVHADQSYVFVIAQVPTTDRDGRPVLSQVCVFAGADFVVTIHDSNVKPLRRLFAAASTDEIARKQLLARGSGYLLYRVLDTLVKNTFPIVYKMDEDLGQFETQLFSNPIRTLLQPHTQLVGDIISLKAMIEPNVAVFDMLRSQNLPFLRVDEARYFGDLADGAHKLLDLLNEQRETAANMTSTMAILNAQQPNLAQRITLIALLVLLPLVLLAAIATLALVVSPQEQPIIFASALVVTLVISAGLVLYGRNQRWF